MKTKLFYGLGVAIVVLALLVGSLLPGASSVSGAPQAAVTPVSVDATAGLAPAFVEWANARVFTADAVTPCIDMGRFQRLDLYYKIDQGTVNTTTLTMHYGNKTTELLAGLALVSANAADATGGNQYQRFMRHVCIDVNVANSNPITITVNAWAQ